MYTELRVYSFIKFSFFFFFQTNSILRIRKNTRIQKGRNSWAACVLPLSHGPQMGTGLQLWKEINQSGGLLSALELGLTCTSMVEFGPSLAAAASLAFCSCSSCRRCCFSWDQWPARGYRPWECALPKPQAKPAWPSKAAPAPAATRSGLPSPKLSTDPERAPPPTISPPQLPCTSFFFSGSLCSLSFCGRRASSLSCSSLRTKQGPVTAGNLSRRLPSREAHGTGCRRRNGRMDTAAKSPELHAGERPAGCREPLALDPPNLVPCFHLT